MGKFDRNIARWIAYIFFFSGTSTSICPYQLTFNCVSMAVVYELLIFYADTLLLREHFPHERRNTFFVEKIYSNLFTFLFIGCIY